MSLHFDHWVSQTESPLFGRIPAEIRTQVFRQALTAHYDKSRPFPPTACFYRPGHRYALKIDTNLLLTCRRVYNETAALPVAINEYCFWYWRAPPSTDPQYNKIYNAHPLTARRQQMKTFHLFTQQFWLEDTNMYAGSNQGFASWVRLRDVPELRPSTLIITIRHSDWWWWESGQRLKLDPKKTGQADLCNLKRPTDGFDKRSWGAQFSMLSDLQELRLELETVESKKNELDVIVERARGWKFLTKDNVQLVLDPSKTKRTGWKGAKLNKNNPRLCSFSWVSQQLAAAAELQQKQASANEEGERKIQRPDGSMRKGTRSTARDRLIADGIAFDDEESLLHLKEEDSLTYYVVTLTWRAQRQ